MDKVMEFVTCGAAKKEDFSPPESFNNMYRKALTKPGEFTKELAEKTWDKNWVTHPNGFDSSGATPLPSGPGMEYAFLGITQFFGAIMPELKWTTFGTLKIDCPEKGMDLYLHIGSGASPTPAAFPMGDVEKPVGDFKIMAIDLHGVSKDTGLITESWHIEEWIDAATQVQSTEPAVLHGGQDIGKIPKQTKIGKAITWDEAPKCMYKMYKEFLSNPAAVTPEMTAEAMHPDWNSHPNALEAGKPGPGSAGAAQMFSGFLGQVIPDLKWKTLKLFEVKCQGGTCYIHLGTGEGTPKAPIWGVEKLTDRSFNVMALDVHYVVDGRIKESWHVEEWMDAARQIKGGLGSASPKKIPPLHRNQPVGW